MNTTWAAKTMVRDGAVAEFVAARGLTTERLVKYSNGSWSAVFHPYNRRAVNFAGSLTACTAFLRANRKGL